MNSTFIAITGYAVAFLMIWLLLRYEYEMPRIASFALGTAAIALGFGMAFAGHLLGPGSIPECSGASSSVLFVMVAGIAIVG